MRNHRHVEYMQGAHGIVQRATGHGILHRVHGAMLRQEVAKVAEGVPLFAVVCRPRPVAIVQLGGG